MHLNPEFCKFSIAKPVQCAMSTLHDEQRLQNCKLHKYIGMYAVWNMRNTGFQLQRPGTGISLRNSNRNCTLLENYFIIFYSGRLTRSTWTDILEFLFSWRIWWILQYRKWQIRLIEVVVWRDVPKRCVPVRIFWDPWPPRWIDPATLCPCINASLTFGPT